MKLNDLYGEAIREIGTNGEDEIAVERWQMRLGREVDGIEHDSNGETAASLREPRAETPVAVVYWASATAQRQTSTAIAYLRITAGFQ